MIQRIELLVHAGAPSGRKDDDRHKAQADAYLNFKGRRVDLVRSNRQLQDASPLQTTSTPGRYEDTIIPAMDDTTIYLDDTQLAYTALDSQLITSSLQVDNEAFSLRPVANVRVPSSPERAPPNSRPEQHGSDNATHCDDEPSAEKVSRKRRLSDNGQNSIDLKAAAADDPPDASNHHLAGSTSPGVSESSYLKTPILDRSTKKQRTGDQAKPDCVTLKPSSVPGYIPLHENGRIGVAYIGDQPKQSTEPAILTGFMHSEGSNANDRATSELPTSYSLSDITSESSRAKTKERPEISQRSSSDPGPVTGSRSSNASSVLSISNRSASVKRHQPVAEQPTVGENSAFQPPLPTLDTRCQDQAKPTALERAKQPDYGHERDNHVSAPETADVQAAKTSLSRLSITIRPPEPAVALGKFSSHITDTLHYLAETSDVANSYKPISLSRELRPLERGHWLVNCSCWPLQAQIDFWRFLEKTVGGGNSGWGVWCTREVSEEDNLASKASGIGSVKVFCWGEVVKHVYLVLYVASKSKVRKLGLQWIDADEEAVVQMRTA